MRITNCVSYSYSLVIFAFSEAFHLIILELQNDNIEENKLFYKKVLNSAFEKEKLRVGGEGGVSIKKNMGERDKKCEKDRK